MQASRSATSVVNVERKTSRIIAAHASISGGVSRWNMLKIVLSALRHQVSASERVDSRMIASG